MTGRRANPYGALTNRSSRYWSTTCRQALSPFSLDILGTGTGSYTISVFGGAGLLSDISSVSGDTNLGERRTVTFSLNTAKPEFLYPRLLAGGAGKWALGWGPTKPLSRETTPALSSCS